MRWTPTVGRKRTGQTGCTRTAAHWGRTRLRTGGDTRRSPCRCGQGSTPRSLIRGASRAPCLPAPLPSRVLPSCRKRGREQTAAAAAMARGGLPCGSRDRPRFSSARSALTDGLHRWRAKAPVGETASQMRRAESLRRFGARVAIKSGKGAAPKLANGSVWWSLEGLSTTAIQSVSSLPAVLCCPGRGGRRGRRPPRPCSGRRGAGLEGAGAEGGATAEGGAGRRWTLRRTPTTRRRRWTACRC